MKYLKILIHNGIQLLLWYQSTHYYDTSNIWIKSKLIIMIKKGNELIRLKPRLTSNTNTWINMINKLISRLSLMQFEMNIGTTTDIILDILWLNKIDEYLNGIVICIKINNSKHYNTTEYIWK